MKNLKNLMAAMAFIFAVGAAFAFTTPESSLLTQSARKQVSCTIGFISQDCVLGASGSACMIGSEKAVDPSGPCLTAQVFAIPIP